MPLKEKYQSIYNGMIKEYGKDKGESIFWAWVNKQGIRDKVEQKSYFIYGNIKSVNDDEVTGYISTYDSDYYNDIVTKNCMSDMYEQLNNTSLKIDLEHESFRGETELDKQLNKTLNPIAKVVDKFMDDKGILVKTVLNKNHKRYAEAKGSIKDGFLDAFSIAYIPEKVRFEEKDGKRYRYLDKVKLLNAAFTGIPVNSHATFTQVAIKSIDDFDDNVSNEDIEIILKSFKKGGFVMNEEEYKSLQVKVDDIVKSSEELKGKLPELEKAIAELKSANELLIAEKAKTKEEMDKMKEEEECKKKEAECKNKETLDAFEAKLKELEIKHIEIDKILSAPQFKSKVEQMEVSLNKQVSVKGKGPLDFL